jgi:hypothetical protein
MRIHSQQCVSSVQFQNLHLKTLTRTPVSTLPNDNGGIQLGKQKIRTLPISVADPHRKNADSDPGKNLNADADSDADLCPY